MEIQLQDDEVVVGSDGTTIEPPSKDGVPGGRQIARGGDTGRWGSSRSEVGWVEVEDG